MATITKIGDKWRAQVRRSGHKSIARTFATHKDAEQWARRVEAELDAKQAELTADAITVAALVREYRRLRESLGRPVVPDTNTHYMLNHLADDLGVERVIDLTPKRLAEWAKMRQGQGAGGYTVNMELSQLGTMIRHTSSFMGINLPNVVATARPLLNYGQLISGGHKRTRRPTEDELDAVIDYIAGRSKIVADAVAVSSIIGLRRSELARITWADLDEARKAVLVRKRKHPRRIEAMDEWVPLLGESWAVVKRQERSDARIFPVSPETLTDHVTTATRALGIPDLRLHDMRRNAASALRDLGFDQDSRKAIVGHKSDEIHSRYVVVSLESLHQQYDDAQGKKQRPQRQRKATGHRS